MTLVQLLFLKGIFIVLFSHFIHALFCKRREFTDSEHGTISSGGMRYSIHCRSNILDFLVTIIRRNGRCSTPYWITLLLRGINQVLLNEILPFLSIFGIHQGPNVGLLLNLIIRIGLRINRHPLDGRPFSSY